MDELDSLATVEDTDTDKRNLSTSSKESEPENLEAIKNFIENHDKNKSDKEIQNETQDETQKKDDILIEIDDSTAESSIQSDKDETLAIASSVMDLIFNESADKLSKNDESTPQTSTTDKGATSVSLSVGSKVEARDFAETWYSAEIVEVDYDEMEVLVRYDSITKKSEEWISVNSPRLRPVTGQLKAGEVKCSISATVEKAQTMKPAKVTQETAPVKEEEKIEGKLKLTFAVGERCLARWRDNRRFVATVQDVLEDGTYAIAFDDGFNWKCSISRLSKLKSSHKSDSMDSRGCSTPSPTPGTGPSTSVTPPVFHTHLFDPTRDYLGPKSERREQKRKLNIKEIFNIGQKQRKKETPVKEEKLKTPKVKRPRILRKNVKVEPKTEKKDIPDAIASIIGMVNNGKGGVKKESGEVKVKSGDNGKSKSKEIKSYVDNAENSESIGRKKGERTSVLNLSDEDTQSAKLSDTEFDTFDDHDDVNMSGDQDDKFSDDPDGKMSIDKIKEEEKLQNFEKPDDSVHEQEMDRIKEAINKLEDGLNRELNAGSPKIIREIKPASPKVKKELTVDSSKTNVEVNIDSMNLDMEHHVDSPPVDIEQNVDTTQENTECNANSPKVNIEENKDSPKVTVDHDEESPKITAENTSQLEVKVEPNAESTKANIDPNAKPFKIETVKEDPEKPILKEEIKPEPSSSKAKKSKKSTKNLLKLAQRIRVLGQDDPPGSEVEINTKIEHIKKEMKEILMMFEKEVPDKEPETPTFLEGEWCCKWVNGEPIGTVVETEPDNRIDVLNRIALPRKTVQVEDKRLPEGWTKLMVRRSLGHSAGKWDVVLVSPDKRRFHTKTDMRNYLENNPDPALKTYEPVLLDFAVHLKLARRMGWVSGDPSQASRGLVSRPLKRNDPSQASRGLVSRPLKRKKLMLKRGEERKDRKVKKRKLGSNGRYKYERAPIPGTSGSSSMLDSSGNISFDNSTLEDGYVYVGSLKVQVIDNLLRCPAEGCFKNFRNNTLLQMHIKHYHRELRKSLGATPKVLDLAYARTRPTVTETRQRHEPDNKIIKVKIKPPKRIEEKLDMKEINIDPSDSSPVRPREEKIPRSLDSPIMRQFALQASNSSKPVKRPKVLLPVRRPEPQTQIPAELETTDDLPDFPFDNTPIEPRVTVPELPELDFETAISTHTVSKPPEFRKKAEKRKVFATISKAPSEDEDMTGMASDVDTRSSFPGSGTPDSKTMEPRAATQNAPMSSESNEDSAMYMYTETGERIKLERMKREEIINCHCGFREEDGLMVQCELCLCWQHALCHNIQREADVPQKYTCSICLSPRRGRRSQRFLHDQDRLAEGRLPGAPPSRALRRSHALSAHLLHVADALHALRVQCYVATKKNHPKLYLWAKDWDTPEATFPQDKPNAYSDLSVIINNMTKNRSDTRDVTNVQTEDNEDRLSQNGSLSNHSLLGGLLSSPGGPSLDMPISTTELERLAKTVQEQVDARAPAPTPAVKAPQPEAAIKNDACRERLLRHVQRCQALIDARLDTLEAEIIELESQDPSFEDDETADYFPRTKQTVQMLLRDLHTMQTLGLVT